MAGGGILGSQKNIGTTGARNSSYNGPRGQMQATGLSSLNKDALQALNKQNQRTSKRGFGTNKLDEIENALNVRASKGDLRPDYMPK